MWVEYLHIDGLRCLRNFELDLAPGLNVLLGANGVGKTSVLEAVYLLGSGRSFRGGGKEALIAYERERFTISARLRRAEVTRQIGFERRKQSWTARLDGANVPMLAELARQVPVLAFEPGSHELITGPAEGRRRFLDWLVFHVEPLFADAYFAFQRVLKQRNALLKAEASNSELAAWLSLLIDTGERLRDLRVNCVAQFARTLGAALAELLPELGTATFQHGQGWLAEESYQHALERTLVRDRALRYTSRGPHRADWSVCFTGAPDRSHLSRGQEKSLCFASVVALLHCFQQARQESAILCLDDLFSELDVAHQGRCLVLAARVTEQVLVTGVASSPALSQWPGACRVFHVEHGTREEL